MAIIRVSPTLWNDPEIRKAFVNMFPQSRYPEPLTQDKYALVHEYRVEIPPYGANDYVDVVFTRTTQGVVQVASVNPISAVDPNFRKMSLTTLQEKLKTQFPGHQNQVDEFLLTFRYKLYTPDVAVNIKDFNLDEHFVSETMLSAYISDFEVYCDLKPTPQWFFAYAPTGKTFKCRSKYSDVEVNLSKVRLDRFVILNEDTI